MARRKWSLSTSQIGSESLIDVLSNTVGGLALLCILASLDAGNLRWRLFITEEKAADTSPVRFVVGGGFIRVFELDRLSTLGNERMNQSLVPASREFPFDVAISPVEGNVTSFELRDSAEFRGDRLSDFFAEKGWAYETLRAKDNKKFHVFLYLAADSFGDYIRLRDLMKKNGFEIGWMPMQGPLRFQSGGTGRALKESIDVGT
jgi:hypothetical protein